MRLTLFVSVSIEEVESWDIECLRTPRGAGPQGVKEDGEQGGRGEFKLNKGMTLSCCDSPVSSITWLLGTLSEDMDPSVREERRERLSFPFLKYIFSHM